MASTFSQQVQALSGATAALVAARAKMQQAKAQFQSAVADLASIGTTYGATFTDITNAATAAPSNTALVNNSAEAAALTSEFQALQTVGNNVVAAATV